MVLSVRRRRDFNPAIRLLFMGSDGEPLFTIMSIALPSGLAAFVTVIEDFDDAFDASMHGWEMVRQIHNDLLPGLGDFRAAD